MENSSRRHPTSPSCPPHADGTYPHEHTPYVCADTLTFELIGKIWSCILGDAVHRSLHVAVKPPISLSLAKLPRGHGYRCWSWSTIWPCSIYEHFCFRARMKWENERHSRFQPLLCFADWHRLLPGFWFYRDGHSTCESPSAPGSNICAPWKSAQRIFWNMFGRCRKGMRRELEKRFKQEESRYQDSTISHGVIFPAPSPVGSGNITGLYGHHTCVWKDSLRSPSSSEDLESYHTWLQSPVLTCPG